MTTSPRASTHQAAAHSLVSQLSNSLGNVLLTFLVARHATQDAYGAWAIGYAAYMMSLAGARATTGTPLLLGRYFDHNALRRSASGALVVSTLAGGFVALLLLTVGAFVPHLWGMLWPIAVLLPVLLAQDTARHFCFTRGRHSGAAVMDISWLALQAVAFVVLETGSWATPSVVTLTWALCAVPGLLGLALRHRLIPTPSHGLRFWRDSGHDAVRLLAEASLSSMLAQALPMVVALAAGLSAAGALRGGLTLIGLVNIMVAGLTPVATLAARREYEASGSTRRFLMVWTVVLGIASLVFGLAILLLPDALGRQFLGATWMAASALLLPLVLQSMVRGPYTGVPIILRATGRVGAALKLRLVTSIPSLAFPWGGAILAGAEGAVWGIFAGALAANLLSLRRLLRTDHGSVPGPA